MLQQIPYLEVLSEKYSIETNERTVEILFHCEGNEWTTVRIEDELTSWSLADEIPERHDGAYVIRHAGGHGTQEWKFSLTFKGANKSTLKITGSHFVFRYFHFYYYLIGLF